jgi:hypothetical protein
LSCKLHKESWLQTDSGKEVLYRSIAFHEYWLFSTVPLIWLHNIEKFRLAVHKIYIKKKELESCTVWQDHIKNELEYQ